MAGVAARHLHARARRDRLSGGEVAGYAASRAGAATYGMVKSRHRQCHRIEMARRVP